uniref:Uncharacterized protein n=1 Tax=Marseillevirus LCMAC101 TaxID=2506602 RepID=A0A481YQW6_9VIRU|nr:MAG: hypothetical protein LCMAC101_02160 [Marseillevirus LCMAC101]
MAEEFRDFIVEAKVRLLRRVPDSDDEEDPDDKQDYELNMVKVDHVKKKNMHDFAYEELNSKSFFMWLYYTPNLSGLVFHVLDKSVSFSEHTFTVTVKARYIFPKKCTKEYLEKSVNGVFNHWSRAGYVSYILDEFNILSADYFGDGTVTPDIFVNLT